MSRKAKLASMLAAAQAERDPFVEGSGALDALGGHVRELLVNCKTSEGFSEDVFKAALIQVKTQLQRLADIISTPLLNESIEIVTKFARAMLEYGRAKRAQASDVLPARLDEVHKFGNLYKEVIAKMRAEVAKLGDAHVTPAGESADPATKFLPEVVSPRVPRDHDDGSSSPPSYHHARARSSPKNDHAAVSSSPSTSSLARSSDAKEKDEVAAASASASRLSAGKGVGKSKRDSFGGGHKCHYCTKPVFFAERKEYQKLLFHISCFNHWFREQSQDVGVWGAHYAKPSPAPSPSSSPKIIPMSQEAREKAKEKENKEREKEKANEKSNDKKHERLGSDGKSSKKKTKKENEEKDKKAYIKTRSPRGEKDGGETKDYSFYHTLSNAARLQDDHQVITWMDDKLYVWDLQKGQVLRCFAGHTAQVKCAAVVGRCTQAPRVVSASSKEVLVWDPLTCDFVHDVEADGVLRIANDPDNDLALDITIGFKEKKKLIEMSEKWVLEEGNVCVSKD